MSRFEELSGHRPDGMWAAPGRVNLIGEHTDYNGGLVLPVAIDRTCVVEARRRDDGVLRCWSVQQGQGAEVPVSELGPGIKGWSAYALGTAWALCEAGIRVPGADIVVDSDVPAGAGLSSSAALECAVGLTLLDLAGESLAPEALARAAQRAEVEVVGAPVGLMDQMASVLGRADHAVFLDCGTGETRLLHLPLDKQGLELVVLDTRVTHDHASGAYATRRRECFEAAQLMGLTTLRDATLDHLESVRRELGDVRYRRARHVVTENARVLDTVAALARGDIEAVGELFAASHASLAADFEVTVPELDLAVEAALEAGAVAARMTGGGFGGCVISLVPHGKSADVHGVALERALAAGFPSPTVHVVYAADGARRIA